MSDAQPDIVQVVKYSDYAAGVTLPASTWELPDACNGNTKGASWARVLLEELARKD